MLLDVLFISCNKAFWNSMISAWVGTSQTWPGTNFLNPENRSFENVLLVTFKYILDIPLLNNLFIFLNLFNSLIELKALLNNLFFLSVVKRPTDSTTSTTSGQTDTTSGQTSTTSGQTSTTSGQTGTTSGQTNSASGKTSTTSWKTSTLSGRRVLPATRQVIP